MNLLSWLQSLAQDAAVLLGLVAVVNVSFQEPIIISDGEDFRVILFLENGCTDDVAELLKGSVHLSITYHVTIYKKNNRKKNLEFTREAVYQSLHDRYRLTGDGFHGSAETIGEAAEFLQTLEFSIPQHEAYSCVVSSDLHIISFSDPDLEARLWGNKTPGITFYFPELE